MDWFSEIVQYTKGQFTSLERKKGREEGRAKWEGEEVRPEDGRKDFLASEAMTTM